MPDSFLRALLLSAVPPDATKPIKSYRKAKPARAYAKDYLQGVVSIYMQERRLFWEHIQQQHERLQAALELDESDYALLMGFKPKLGEAEVKLLDVPNEQLTRCYRLSLKCVLDLNDEEGFLLAINCYALRGFPRRFQWGDDLSAFLKGDNMFSPQFLKFRSKRQLSLKYMSRLEGLYAPLLSEEELQELLAILNTAALEDV